MHKVLALSGLVALGLVGAPAAAGAHHPPPTRGGSLAVIGSAGTGDLRSLNNSGGSGTAKVSVRGDQVTVSIRSRGLSPNLPHAQHLHIGGRGECPAAPADANRDGLIDTAEGQPSYGEVKVSLTTTGDVGPGSALAVDRFPVAGADGTIDYRRTFALPAGMTTDQVRDAVVVQHGVAELFGDRATYDGEPRSSLDSSLPLEATIPSTCGELAHEGLLETLLEALGLSQDDDDAGRDDLLGRRDANSATVPGVAVGSATGEDGAVVRIGINGRS